MEQILRYHLEDKGQDLLYLDVEVSENGIGIIVDTNPVPYKEFYVGKPFNKNDNLIGSNFNYAVPPTKGFRVRELRYKIVSIENLVDIF